MMNIKTTKWKSEGDAKFEPEKAYEFIKERLKAKGDILVLKPSWKSRELVNEKGEIIIY